MLKPFSTFRQQLKILRNRNLIINDGSKAIEILERENYYYLINGYKNIFLDNTSATEKYQDRTTFKDIYSLFCFDRNLRIILLKNLLEFENILKTHISYYFAEEYRTDFNYFNINNFNCATPDKRANTTKLIATLSKVIEEKTKEKKSTINHYLYKHKCLPIWVLIRQITFGATCHFYSSLKVNLQNKISKNITKRFFQKYPSKKNLKGYPSIPLPPEQLESIMNFTNEFRNICAHDERLYNYTSTKTKLKKTFLHFHSNLKFKGNLFDVILILKFFVPKNNYIEMIAEIKKELNKLQKKINNLKYNEILQEMGFIQNWDKIVLS